MKQATYAFCLHFLLGKIVFNKMRIGKAIVVIGAVVIIAGIIFHFQGQGTLGPESSFMHSNPEWITYGLEVVILGIGVIITGVWLTISKRG